MKKTLLTIAALIATTHAASAAEVIGDACAPIGTGTDTLAKSSTKAGEGVIQCVPDINGNYFWQAMGGVARYDATASCNVAGLLRWDGSSVQFCDGAIWQNVGGVPKGAVQYFALAACPVGWLAADGQNGTPDLRGEFLRAWDSGRGVDGGRVLGSWQAATSLGLWINQNAIMEVQHADSSYAGGYNVRLDGFNPYVHAQVFQTVRPRNVALLVCIKQ